MGTLICCCCYEKEPSFKIELKQKLTKIVESYSKLNFNCKFICIYEIIDDSRDLKKIIDLEDLNNDKMDEKKDELRSEEQQRLLTNANKNETKHELKEIKDGLNGQTIGSLNETTSKLLDILKEAKLLQKIAQTSNNKTIHIRGNKLTLFSYYLISYKYCCITFVQSNTPNDLKNINYSQINDFNKRPILEIHEILKSTNNNI